MLKLKKSVFQIKVAEKRKMKFRKEFMFLHLDIPKTRYIKLKILSRENIFNSNQKVVI